jgi:hypothetical protein
VMRGGSGGLGSGGLPLPLLVGACCVSVRVERGESEGGVCVRLRRVLSGCGVVVCWQHGDGLWLCCVFVGWVVFWWSCVVGPGRSCGCGDGVMCLVVRGSFGRCEVGGAREAGLGAGLQV